MKAQEIENQTYTDAFQKAYRTCPTIPPGLLEAISFTNTHCHHLTDADYHHEGPDAMPRTYGLMGLVKDGKNYFRENLHLVSRLSGISEAEILESPEANVKAYAMAFDSLARVGKVSEINGYLSVIQQLSELPIGEEKDVYPMQSMLYSVCVFLNDSLRAVEFGFPKYDIDLKASFREHYDKLAAPSLKMSRLGDYPGAIWDPAPECNWEERTKEVSAVVIHDTEGSYAGSISWFKNCDAQVSAHYVIRSVDGQITQMVREKDKAWHARTANGYTIGIEHEGYVNNPSYYTEAMYRSSADLVRNICSRYEAINGLRVHNRDTLDNGICLNNGLYDLGGEGACVQVKGHQHYPDQSHTDPGLYWDWDYYYKLVNDGTPVAILEGEEGRLDHVNYGNDEREIWVIRGPEQSVIRLDFSSFDLETDFDFLWIYDGDNVYAPKIGRWNTNSPGQVESSGNVMCIEFRSDCLTTDAGWEASWTAVDTTHVGPEIIEPEAGVFPNPTDGVFTIQSNQEGFVDVTVFDVCGNVMASARFIKSIDIDASNWDAGVYVVNYGTPLMLGKVVKLVKL
ncbi:MAG: N-acetylmuramoyl-L-alanine amidase [Bacteroidales bacterium]|nr:N-acetylmuramoyl-L-alanine amidase [Bacteroidales bacterium]